nr:hypothetical protein [uncultured Flavobacterium sp.]
MKKIVFLILLSTVIFSCTTTRTVTTKSGESIEVNTNNVYFRDDFTKVSDQTKADFLSKHKANSDAYSMLILTSGYKGEIVKVNSTSSKIYEGTTYTVKSNGIAGYMRVKNSDDILITDDYTKQTALISADHLKKYKFVYVLKDNANKKQPYKITFSNSLRPL